MLVASIALTPEREEGPREISHVFDFTGEFVSAPDGALCGNHAGVAATNICARCGTFICATCSVGTQSGVFCPRCFTPSYTLGDRGKRFVANIVDNLVATGPMILGLVAWLLIEGVRGERRTGDAAAFLMFGGMGLGLVVGVSIQIVMQVRLGQSVGKRLLGLKVVRVDGSACELWRLILLRNVAVHALAQLCGFVGIIDALMIFSAQQRCLHDLMADTVVIEFSGI